MRFYFVGYEQYMWRAATRKDPSNVLCEVTQRPSERTALKQSILPQIDQISAERTWKAKWKVSVIQFKLLHGLFRKLFQRYSPLYGS